MRKWQQTFLLVSSKKKKLYIYIYIYNFTDFQMHKQTYFIILYPPYKYFIFMINKHLL
ncbi:MAG: hypothetical protein MCS20_01145 [Candidatus Phytoplasma mali]|nr:hypothetical protein [Candidatus Phytoplasma australiense]MCG7202005.1 hypothetical protein [Candidatus Phytoplasma mali]